MRLSLDLEREAPSGVAEAANAALATLAPPSVRAHFLHCYWEAGESWCPVERFVVAEMIPRRIVYAQDALARLLGDDSVSLFAELEGPDPRARAQWSRALGRLVYPSHALPPAITRRQWLLWRSHAAYAMPVWVVQGAAGGHKRHFSPSEASLLRLHGKPGEAPVPGALPYAPPDARTVAALAEHGRLAGLAQALRSGEGLDAVRKRRAEAERGFNASLLKWLDAQVHDATHDGMSGGRAVAPSDLAYDPAAARRLERDAALAEHRFLTQTMTSAPDALRESEVEADRIRHDFRDRLVVGA